MRKLNDYCIQPALILPDLNCQLKMNPTDVKYFGVFDCKSGSDLLKVDNKYTKYFDITTLYGNFQMLGAPMGFIGTPVNYQNRILKYILGFYGGKGTVDEGLFCRPGSGCLLRLDDVLIYSNSWEGYLKVLKTLFTRLKKFKVKLNLEKSEILKTKVTWCGRTISPKGWKFSETHYLMFMIALQKTECKLLL